MKDKFVLRAKKAIKKIAALAGSAVVLGATVATPAMAATLADLPQPFVNDNGVFDAYVVVGASAQPADVLAAVDIAAAFAQVATASGSSGTATVDVLTAQGKSLGSWATNGFTPDDIYVEGSGSSSFSDTDARGDDAITGLANVEYEKSGNKYNATVSVSIDKSKISIKPDRSLFINESAIQVTMDVNNGTDLNICEGDKINWFGTTYDVVEVNSSAVVLGSTEINTYKVGETFTVGDYTFTLQDVDGTHNKAIIKNPDGTTVEVDTGEWKTYEDVRYKLESVWSGATTNSAKIATAESNYVLFNNKVFPIDDRYNVTSLPISSDCVSSITVTSTFTDNTLDAKKDKVTIGGDVGIVYDDYSQSMTLPSSDWTSVTNGEYIAFKESGMQSMNFDVATDTNVAENTTVLLPGVKYWKYTGSDLTVYSGGGANISKGEYILLGQEVDGAPHYYLKIVSDGSEVDLYKPATSTNETTSYAGPWTEVSEGANYTMPNGMIAESKNGDDNIWLKAAVVDVAGSTNLILPDGVAKVYSTEGYDEYYTPKGAKITWDGEDTATLTQGDGTTISVKYTWNTSNGAALITDKSSILVNGVATTAENETGSAPTSSKAQSTDYKSYVALYGSDWESAANTNDIVYVYYPTYTSAFKVGGIAPTTVTLTTDETKTVGDTTLTLKSAGGVQLNKITPGIGLLDTEYDQDKNVILVGGPAVNTLVADLAAVDGSTVFSAEKWRTETTPGVRDYKDKATIDLVESAFGDYTALVVAGYDAKDTRLAAKVIAAQLLGHKDYAFTGNHVLLDTSATSYEDVQVTTETTEESTE